MVLIHKKNESSKEEKEQQKLQAERERAGIRDEFQIKGFELVSFVQTHKAVVTALIFLFFFVGLGFSLYVYLQQRTKEEASSAYLNAIKLMDGEDKEKEEAIKKSLEALKKVAIDYKSTKISILANISAAQLALKQNNALESVKLFENALSQQKENDELYPLSLMGLGYALEANGQIKESREAFLKVLQIKDNYALEISLWESARLASLSDEKEKAKEYLKRLKEEFPSSAYERSAKRLSDSLK